MTFAGQLAGLGGATQLPFNETQNRWTEGDDITWTKGAQTIKFGAAISRLQTNTYMPFRIGSIWAFGGLAGLLGGVPNTVTWAPLSLPASLPGGPGPAYANRDYRDTEFTPYFQDDWKVSQKLTLNLGIRTEHEVVPSFRAGINALDFSFSQKLAPEEIHHHDIVHFALNELMQEIAEVFYPVRATFTSGTDYIGRDTSADTYDSYPSLVRRDLAW